MMLMARVRGSSLRDRSTYPVAGQRGDRSSDDDQDQAKRDSVSEPSHHSSITRPSGESDRESGPRTRLATERGAQLWAITDEELSRAMQERIGAWVAACPA